MRCGEWFGGVNLQDYSFSLVCPAYGLSRCRNPAKKPRGILDFLNSNNSGLSAKTRCKGY